MAAVLVCVFDPVDELDGRMGVLAVAEDVAARLIAAHQGELVETHANDELRFVTGSAAFVSARDALRVRRGETRKRGRRE